MSEEDRKEIESQVLQRVWQKRSMVSLPFCGDTFCKGKNSEPVSRLDFQRDKAAWKRLKRPGKGIRILSPRFFIVTSRAGPATGTAVGSLLTNSRFRCWTHADYRNKDYASALLERASEIAREHRCYKVFWGNRFK